MPSSSAGPQSKTSTANDERILAATGIEGLDDVLGGGFRPDRLYLIEGVPGSGKTTLSLQFLREGVRLGESVLYITLSETEEKLLEVAEPLDNFRGVLTGIPALEGQGRLSRGDLKQ